MEAMRRRIMEEQMAAIEKARKEQQEQQDHLAHSGSTSTRPFNPEISSIPARNKHAAPPKVKLYQPATNLPPPPSLSSSNSSSSTASTSTSTRPGVAPSNPNPPKLPPAPTLPGPSQAYQPFRPPSMARHTQTPFYSMTVPGPTTGPFANSLPPHLVNHSAFDPPAAAASAMRLEGDPLDEPEPPLGAGPYVTSSDRDKQLQDMVAHMVNVVDADVSKAKIDGMKCMLLPHQIQGVQWMKDREMGKYKGGILADDMGLGKTVQMLALIVSNKPGQEGASIDKVVDEAPSKKRGPKPKYKPPVKAPTPSEDTWRKADIKGKSTLIIAPLAVVKQWEREVNDKTNAGLRVYVHHGTKRAKTAATLAGFDIIITTYTTAASEYSNFIGGKDESRGGKAARSDSEGSESAPSGTDSASESDDDGELSRKKPTKKPTLGTKKKAPLPSRAKVLPAPLFETDWLRVVLDEAQNIKNHKAKCSKACFSLSNRAHSRWCLTGTPIQNNCYELYSLIHFLRIAPFDEYDHFKKLIGDPLKASNQNRVNWGMKRLCIVLQTIMLRRTKDATHQGKPILQLPDRDVQVISCDFDDPEERTFYADLEGKIRTNKKKADEKQEKTNMLADLVMLLRLRQACSHPMLTISKRGADMEEVAAPKIDNVETADAAGVDGADNDDDDDDLAAMFSSLTVAKKLCERCQAPLPYPPPANSAWCVLCTAVVAKIQTSEWGADKGSTKIRMMLKILDEIRRGDPGEKTIVFSQFTSFLNLVEPFLKKHKYKFVRYDGSMRPEQRELNLTQIRSDPSTTVILISFKAGSTGLNLTCCSRVILMDLWWNPQIEEQAFDRAHRLGQQRDVKIYKLSITETVEERILELQDKKRNLAKAALEGSKLAKANRLDRNELLYLFNGGPRDAKRGA